ncbi:MAG: hypothetical protein ACRDNW_06140 [Trebonia sp.]
MNDDTLPAALRYFPLTGRPRPACLTLPERVAEVTVITRAARQAGADVAHHAAHALNKAALLASDCGLDDLARDLCWRHIDAYCGLGRALAVTEARGILEPALNLARLAIRQSDCEQALRVLDSIYQALTEGTDLSISGKMLPLAGLAVTQAEYRKLREWAWLQHLSEGIRANALLGRWNAAERHAIQHRGIGDHLLEGRQAAIITRLVSGNQTEAAQILADSTVTEPWEQSVAACLSVMCADEQQVNALAAKLADGFTAAEPVPGYAVYRARLGLTIVTLAAEPQPAAATRTARTVAAEAIASADGNAAREVLRHQHASSRLPPAQLQSLRSILDAAGLAAGSIAEPFRSELLTAAAVAGCQLRAALHSPGDDGRPSRMNQQPTAGPSPATRSPTGQPAPRSRRSGTWAACSASGTAPSP